MLDAGWVADGDFADRSSMSNRQVVRTVLVVVHTVTAMNRLADVLGVFDGDRRVQLVFAFPDAAMVSADITRALRDLGELTIPWARATTERFDLALSLHHSGNLHEITAPLVLLSHGMGYTKLGKTKNEKRKTKNEKRKTKNEKRTYGLGPDWLLRNGKVFAKAVVLAHKEQLDRLAIATPEALPVAAVAGDPCFDRITASTHLRPAYRARLGASADDRVVLVSSTWGPNSLFGRHPDLISDLVAELTADDHVVAAVLHPNVWFRHGPLQVRRWLADALRSGLRLVPPFRGWQQALLAADAVIGDHGAVTGYAAALGVPTVLATFPEQDVAPGSAVAEVGRAFPRLAHRGRPFQDQLAGLPATPGSAASVSALTTSEPDRSADLLRRLFYELMDLAEPATPPLVEPYPAAHLRPEHRPATAFWLATTWAGDTTVEVRRWPADVTARPRRGPRAVESHLAAVLDHPRRDLRATTAVVLASEPAGLANALATATTAQVAAATDGSGRCHLRYRDGTTAVVTRTDGEPCDAAVCGSIAYGHLRGQRPLPDDLVLRTGGRTVPLTISAT